MAGLVVPAMMIQDRYRDDRLAALLKRAPERLGSRRAALNSRRCIWHQPVCERSASEHGAGSAAI
jgi:hypothetical protein